MVNRRDFLVRTGLALGNVLLAGDLTASPVLASQRQSSTYDNWEWVRDQFPLSRDLIHMAGFFLASHPTPVRAAIERHRKELDENPIGYWLKQAATAEASVLRAAGDYLVVRPADIALTDSTTMGLGLLYGGLAIRRGQDLLSTIHDHYSTDMSLRLRAERTGATWRRVPLYENLRNVSEQEIVDTLIKEVKPRTRLVAVTWVHSSTGLKLPIHAMATALARINAQRDEGDRVIFCVDGVHALGVEDFRLADVGCDFFIAGTHKWMFGPRGTGLVWGHPKAWPLAQAIIPTFHEDAYEIWMETAPPKPLPQSVYMTPGGFHSFEHRWALDAAFTFHQAIGKSRVSARIQELNDQLKEGLTKMPHVVLHTPRSRKLSAGIVCFDVKGRKPQEVVDRLRQRGIMGSVSPYAVQHARLAPSLLTSPEEVDRALAKVRNLA